LFTEVFKTVELTFFNGLFVILPFVIGILIVDLFPFKSARVI